MAADNRPYKSKEQDGQGNEIIIRDQQLVEQASQTTMASGEYFEIVDIDGRMAKIPKANMVDIVREALGSLLNGLSDQTTVTKVPSLNGNTLGASTVATLASVLGETLVPQIPYYSAGLTPNNDLDEGPQTFNSKIVSIGCNNQTLNQPSGMVYAYVFQFGSAASGIWIQFCFNDQKNKFYIRVFWSTWGDWKEI